MNIFNYIIQLGASVMMPIIFTIIGLCIGMKFGKALKSGLYVGVGFVGLGIVTALLTDNFKDPLQAIENIFSLNLSVFDMGWPLPLLWLTTRPWVPSSSPSVLASTSS